MPISMRTGTRFQRRAGGLSAGRQAPAVTAKRRLRVLSARIAASGGQVGARVPLHGRKRRAVVRAGAWATARRVGRARRRHTPAPEPRSHGRPRGRDGDARCRHGEAVGLGLLAALRLTDARDPPRRGRAAARGGGPADDPRRRRPREPQLGERLQWPAELGVVDERRVTVITSSVSSRSMRRLTAGGDSETLRPISARDARASAVSSAWISLSVPSSGASSPIPSAWPSIYEIKGRGTLPQSILACLAPIAAIGWI